MSRFTQPFSRSVLGKELAELRLVTAVFLPLSIVVLIDGTNALGQSFAALNQLCESSWAMIIGAMGLTIGFLQGRTESSPDRLAMHLHRPRTRRHLIAMKFASGWIALGIVILLPLVVASGWQACCTARPLAWQTFILPILSFIAALGCHAAGLFAAVRPGRWFGARLIPPLAALYLCWITRFAAYDMQIPVLELCVRAAAVLVATKCLVLISWSALRIQGEDAELPGWSAPIVSVLCCALGAVVIIWTLNLVLPWTWRGSEMVRYAYEEDGGIAAIHSDTLRYYHSSRAEPLDPNRAEDRRAAQRNDRDADWDFKDGESFNRPITSYGGVLDLGIDDFANRSADELPPPYWIQIWSLPGLTWTSSAMGTHRHEQLRDSAGLCFPVAGSMAWTLTHHYDPFGTIALSQADGEPWWWVATEPYPNHPLGPWTHGGLISIAMDSTTQVENGPEEVVVLADDGCHVYDLAGHELRTTLVPGGLATAVSGQIATGSDGSILVETRSSYRKDAPRDYRKYSAAGRLLWERSVPNHVPDRAILSPLSYVLHAVLPLAGIPIVDDHLDFCMVTSEGNQVHPIWWPALAGGVVSAACAGLVCRRRRLRPARCLFLTALALGFGPAGLLTVLFVEPRPSALRCPACRQWRSLAQPLCEHCHAPWRSEPSAAATIYEPAA